MLQIQHVRKEYHTGKLVQKALDDVSLNLRDNEFVAILGPSGSGKTTLLNIIGGLDQYDSGDLIINGISTKKYKDRDWDSYRNHTIGFVFQSYNLIPHQTLLSNVELALTISGIGKAERRKRAKDALEQVGLGDQMNKRPSQLSGGQMQRVAIARALVNNPDILLADEPTGALDTATSIQVMDLLKEVAKDRLVVMVTHNPELADQYANRIVNLRDGKIISDSNPYVVEEKNLPEPTNKNMGKSSMSLMTSIALSFNNLLTKKARTLLTAFAGSIGIIGIALILALSTGVNDYIASIEEETLAGYPLQITSTGFDWTSLLATTTSDDDSNDEDTEISVIEMITTMFSKMDSNDLASLKEYFDSGESGIEEYVSSIEYIYNITPQVYRQNDDGSIRQVNPDNSFSSLGLGSSSSSSSLFSSMMSTDVFYKLPEKSSLYDTQYDVVAGRWPENYNEVVLVLGSGGTITDFMLYTLGLRDSVELDDMVQQFVDNEEIVVPEYTSSYSYDDVLGITFKLVNSCDYYTYDSQYDIWTDKSGNEEYIKKLVANGEDLTIVGVVEPSEGSSGTVLTSGIYYTSSLITHISEYAADSKIVKSQIANPDTNVLTGEEFSDIDNAGELDLSTLISIDEDTLAEAFDFDTEAMENAFSGSFDLSDAFTVDMNSLDLAGMIDFSDISIELTDMPDMDLSGLFENITFDMSSLDLNSLVSDLLSGYQEYATENSGIDTDSLSESFTEYLESDEAQEILTESLEDILGSGDNLTINMDDFNSFATSLLTEYISYADGDYSTTTILSFIEQGDVQNEISTWLIDNIEINTDLTNEQLSELAVNLVSGYAEYIDMDVLMDSFTEYMATDEANAVMTAAISEMIDEDTLSTQLESALGSYMTTYFTAYGEALADSLESQISTAMTQVMSQVMSQLSSGIETAMEEMVSELATSLQDSMGIDAETFMEAFEFNMDSEELTEMLMSLSSSATSTYESNLESFGYSDFTNPDEIDIYPTDFENKEHVTDILDSYNERMEASGKEDQVITYTDTVGTLMSSVTDIIDVISYVLIAFVGISLVVSSIMIGVITYISVLERKKEIGILRAIGASKGNISEVFNAETGIIGLFAGLLGIGISLLLTIPGNALIHHLAGTDSINMVLNPLPAVILILLSICLTLIGGLIPSRKAAKSDPVEALRTD